MILTAEEIRILGVLVEKDMATPEYYPMSLNALVNGCNQKTNRDPMTAYDDEAAATAVDMLREKQLVSVLTGGSNRVPKYGHRVSEILNVNNREMAVLCVLMLRGAQTLNEIRTRTESLYKFDDPTSVDMVLNKLAERGLTALLPKQAGAREPRWTHLLLGEPLAPSAAAAASSDAAIPGREGLAERVTQLEVEVEALKAQVAELLRQLT